jgi:hypothetical protein
MSSNITYTVYRTTNLINEKIYVGVHATPNVYDSYLGSGKALNRAITKYGRDFFSKEIIARFDESSTAYDLERQIVTESFVKNRSTYNAKLGGHGGWDHVSSSPEITKRIGMTLRGRTLSPEHVQKIKTALTARTRSPEERLAISIGKRNGKKSIPKNPEIRAAKLSAALKGRSKPKTNYCIHCKGWFDGANYQRWHGEKCKVTS